MSTAVPCITRTQPAASAATAHQTIAIWIREKLLQRHARQLSEQLFGTLHRSPRDEVLPHHLRRAGCTSGKHGLPASSLDHIKAAAARRRASGWQAGRAPAGGRRYSTTTPGLGRAALHTYQAARSKAGCPGPTWCRLARAAGPPKPEHGVASVEGGRDIRASLARPPDPAWLTVSVDRRAVLLVPALVNVGAIRPATPAMQQAKCVDDAEFRGLHHFQGLPYKMYTCSSGVLLAPLPVTRCSAVDSAHQQAGRPLHAHRSSASCTPARLLHATAHNGELP